MVFPAATMTTGMNLRNPMRKAASLALMLAVLAWANGALALPAISHVSQCHMQQSHASTMSAMSCCPKHVQSESAYVPPHAWAFAREPASFRVLQDQQPT